MTKYFNLLLLMLMINGVCAFAQNGASPVRDVKLSGKYFFGEGWGKNVIEAENTAITNLKQMIFEHALQNNSSMSDSDFSNYNNDIATVTFDLGGNTKVVAFLKKDEVSFNASTTVAPQPAMQATTPAATQPPAHDDAVLTYESDNEVAPTREEIIAKLIDITAYDEARQLLNKYKYDGYLMYGNTSTLTLPNDCYFMILRNNQVVDILDKAPSSMRESLVTYNKIDYKKVTDTVIWIYIL